MATLREQVNKLPTLKLPKGTRYIGSGSYGIVYKYCKTRVVKVYEDETLEDGLWLAKDEAKGAKKYTNGLPVLRIVKVIQGNKCIGVGVVKRYIPYSIPIKKEHTIPVKTKYDEIDFDYTQYKKDKKGKIFRVDTQTDKIFKIYRY